MSLYRCCQQSGLVPKVLRRRWPDDQRADFQVPAVLQTFACCRDEQSPTCRRYSILPSVEFLSLCRCNFSTSLSWLAFWTAWLSCAASSLYKNLYISMQFRTPTLRTEVENCSDIMAGSYREIKQNICNMWAITHLNSRPKLTPTGIFNISLHNSLRVRNMWPSCVVYRFTSQIL